MCIGHKDSPTTREGYIIRSCDRCGFLYDFYLHILPCNHCYRQRAGCQYPSRKPYHDGVPNCIRALAIPTCFPFRLRWSPAHSSTHAGHIFCLQYRSRTCKRLHSPNGIKMLPELGSFVYFHCILQRHSRHFQTRKKRWIDESTVCIREQREVLRPGTRGCAHPNFDLEMDILAADDHVGIAASRYAVVPTRDVQELGGNSGIAFTSPHRSARLAV